MNDQIILVKKINGEIEPFNIDKLKTSLRRSQANEKEIDEIVETVLSQLYDGITSKEIYKKAFSILKKYNRISASRYSLKRAIFDLGPTGFPFERLVSALLKQHDYTTRVGIVLKGKCVTHEIDVLAEKDGNTYAIECKFHSDPKGVSNVRVPLYINSRFLDIQEQWNKDPKKASHLKQGWLITNTRFSQDAIDYANCVGLHLLSWDYPKNNGIKQNVDKFGLYPITTLTTLSKSEKTQLIDNDVILVTELFEASSILDKIGISSQRIERILEEVKNLCKL